MAITDFLFEGRPPAATTTYGSASSTMPTWYNDYVQGLISKANAVASAPYQSYGGQRLANFNEDQTGAFAGTRGLQSSFARNIDPALSTVRGLQGPGAQNALGQYGAQDLYTQARGINPIADAQGNLDASQLLTGMAGMTPASAGISNYMSPYTSNVVNEIGRLGQENLDNTMSGIADKYISGGQFGGSRMGRSLGNASRAGLRDIAGLQGQALERGYGQALGASQGDLARQLQAAGQFGQLGSAQGNLASQAQQNLANIGQSLGTFGQGDLQRQLEAAKTQGALSQTFNETNLRNLAAQQAVGDTQQNQAQKALDLGYQDFAQQRQYPQEMVSFMNNVIRGLQIPMSQSTTQTGIPQGMQSQASPLLQLASLGSGIAGINQAFK